MIPADVLGCYTPGGQFYLPSHHLLGLRCTDDVSLMGGGDRLSTN